MTAPSNADEHPQQSEHERSSSGDVSSPRQLHVDRPEDAQFAHPRQLPCLPELPDVTDANSQHHEDPHASSTTIAFAHDPHPDHQDDQGGSSVTGLPAHLAAELDAALLLHHQATSSDFHPFDHNSNAYDQSHAAHTDDTHHLDGPLGPYGEEGGHGVEHVSGLVEAIHAFNPEGPYGDYDEATSTNAVASGSGTQPKPPRKKRAKATVQPAETGEPGEKRKREQVKNACTNCAKSRKKCDGERPCRGCMKSGTEGTCVDSERRVRPKGIKRGPYKKNSRPSDDGPSSDLTAAQYASYQHHLSLHTQDHPTEASDMSTSSASAFPHHPYADQHPHDPDQQTQQQQDGTYYDSNAPFTVEGGGEGGPGGRWLVPKKRRGDKKGGGLGGAGRLSEAMIVDEDGTGEGEHGGDHGGGEEEQAYQLDQRQLGELDHQLFPNSISNSDQEPFAQQLAEADDHHQRAADGGDSGEVKDEALVP